MGVQPSRDRNILIMVDKSKEEPLYLQVYDQIRQAIEEGRLVADDRLPSIRSLGAELNMSHVTIEKAYAQLSTEGYIRNIPYSGFVVRELDNAFLDSTTPDNQGEIDAIMAHWEQELREAGFLSGSNCRFDFSYFDLDPVLFPLSQWKKLLDEQLYEFGKDGFSSYPSLVRVSKLQRVLAKFLGRMRGVNCLPEQIMVVPGCESAFRLLLQVFDPHQDLVGHEEPGWFAFLQTARTARFTVMPLPVDQGFEAYRYALEILKPNLIYCTPSNQFPTGKCLTLDERIELLKIAERRNIYILEDDSCSEYRYNTAPLPSLQSLDRSNRVIYLGSLSKLFSPDLRLAYLILPPNLLQKWCFARRASSELLPMYLQNTVAAFIDHGYLEKHIRKLRMHYRRSHDLLENVLKDVFQDRIAFPNTDTGLHFYTDVHSPMDQRQLVYAARNQNCSVYKTSQCWFATEPPAHRLMIGFSRIPQEKIEEGVNRLANAWFG